MSSPVSNDGDDPRGFYETRARFVATRLTLASDAAVPRQFVLITAIELVESCHSDERTAQLHVGAFVDDFRRASNDARERLVADAPTTEGRREGFVSDALSALCRKVGIPVAPCVAVTGSPEPFFAFPAKSLAMRLRLMIESPSPFKIPRVFVPENDLLRA
jgi:hypothetical protein